MRKKLTARALAAANLRRKPGRSFALIFLAAALSALLFFASTLNQSLGNGLEALSERLGADVIVVPQGYRADLESIILKGEPSSFYLPKNLVDELQTVPGIAAYTPQLYVATLSASCCSYPVQIIGIDEESDFLIEPWLVSNLKRSLRDGEAMVGGHIVGEAGEEVFFFDKRLKIAGRLEKTGMGFDATVFVNMKTAIDLARASERLGKNQAAEGNDISCIMIKAKPGIDASKLAGLITERFSERGIFAMAGKRIINTVSTNIAVLGRYIIFLLGSIWLIAFVVLLLSYSSIMNERLPEMATLRVLGAKKSFIRQTFLHEAAAVSVYGSIIGLMIGAILSLAVIPRLSQNLSIPYKSVGLKTSLLFVGLTFLALLIVSLLAAVLAVRRFEKRELRTYLQP